MSDLGQTITDRIKEYFITQFDFYLENADGYLFMVQCLRALNIFSFRNDYFNLYDVDTIEVTHDTVTLNSLNNDNRFEPKPIFDLSLVSLY
jgi:hypothetical protein